MQLAVGETPLQIRHFQTGDEAAQASIYNAAAGPLPKFKPATAEEITRRYRAPGFSPETRFYAVDGEEVVGYAGFDRNGRISYPWHLTGHDDVAVPLLESVLSAMSGLGLPRAWAAYRADWTAVIAFLEEHGFSLEREMINYVAEVDRLPHGPVPADYAIGRLDREALPELLALRSGPVLPDDEAFLGRFFWENQYFGAESIFGVHRRDDGRLLGAGLAIIDPAFADPTRIDPSMPCFRLGAMGTERERHKRVNGFFSASFSTPDAGEQLLGEAARRMRGAGLSHMAAQAASDRSDVVAFHERHFSRQGTFPILGRPTGAARR